MRVFGIVEAVRLDEFGERYENFPLAYWVDYIKALSGSPVLIVQNKVDSWQDKQLRYGVDLQPGDLLFTPGSDGTVLAPGHVGMYVGGGQMISAKGARWGVVAPPVRPSPTTGDPPVA